MIYILPGGWFQWWGRKLVSLKSGREKCTLKQPQNCRIYSAQIPRGCAHALLARDRLLAFAMWKLCMRIARHENFLESKYRIAGYFRGVTLLRISRNDVTCGKNFVDGQSCTCACATTMCVLTIPRTAPHHRSAAVQATLKKDQANHEK